MFSKPLAFVLLALGCLTAAAGGAYMATRHNMSDLTPHPAVSAPAALTSTAAPRSVAAPSHAVAETEAAVTSRAAEPAAEPAEAVPAPVKAEAPAPVSRTAARSADSVRVTEKKPAQTASAAPASTHTARTVPMTNPGAIVAQPDSTTPPQAGTPSSAPSSPVKPAGEPARTIEDPLPEPPRAPLYDELILPAAAVIGLQVETSLTSERARVEDRVDARVSRDVMVAGRVAIPAGSRVVGSVTTVERGGKVKDQARLGIRFHTLVLADGTQVQLRTDPVYRLGEDPSAGSTKKIGGAAIGGAIIGAILGGGKGAAIGGAAGAAGGTAATMSGDRKPATVRQGEYLNVKLSSPATITVERRDS
jgi:hypothetical protein